MVGLRRCSRCGGGGGAAAIGGAGPHTLGGLPVSADDLRRKTPDSSDLALATRLACRTLMSLPLEERVGSAPFIICTQRRPSDGDTTAHSAHAHYCASVHGRATTDLPLTTPLVTPDPVLHPYRVTASAAIW